MSQTIFILIIVAWFGNIQEWRIFSIQVARSKGQQLRLVSCDVPLEKIVVTQTTNKVSGHCKQGSYSRTLTRQLMNINEYYPYVYSVLHKKLLILFSSISLWLNLAVFDILFSVRIHVLATDLQGLQERLQWKRDLECPHEGPIGEKRLNGVGVTRRLPI